MLAKSVKCLRSGNSAPRSGCSAGGHWGHVYVDGCAPVLPVLSVTAYAAQSVNTGSDLTYTYVFKNGGAADTTIAQVMVDDAFWQYEISPGPTLPRLGRATLTLRPFWVGSYPTDPTNIQVSVKQP